MPHSADIARLAFWMGSLYSGICVHIRKYTSWYVHMKLSQVEILLLRKASPKELEDKNCLGLQHQEPWKGLVSRHSRE